MNPLLAKGFEEVGLRRRSWSITPPCPAEEHRQPLRRLSQLFFDYDLGELDQPGDDRQASFECTDQQGFLERIGASELHRENLEGASLVLDITESADKANRSCVLYAMWPISPDANVNQSEPLLEFEVALPDKADDDINLQLTRQGNRPLAVEPKSQELADLEAIAEFFSPVSK